MKNKKNKPRKKMRLWQRIVMIIAIVLLTAGLGFLLFPIVSNTVGQVRADNIIQTYKTAAQSVYDPASPDEMPPKLAQITSTTRKEAEKKGEVDKEGYAVDKNGARISEYPLIFQGDLDRFHEDSIRYNKSLINHQGTPDMLNYQYAALDPDDYGVTAAYAYLEADTIGLHLPIYLGADDWTMSCGAAHLYGTSLPLNMKDTHVAIAGHTGYIGRIFFDNIRNLQIGDELTITNYWETVYYRVIGYREVPPYQSADLLIENNRALLTLITCIPYNTGFGRFLVICEKI